MQVQPFVSSETLKDEGIFVSNEFLSRLETSLIKFQALLDHLERERKQTETANLKTQSSRRSERSQTDRNGDRSQRRSLDPEPDRNGSVHSKSHSASDARPSAHSESHSAAEKSKSEDSASRSAESASLQRSAQSELPSEKYSESFVSSKSADSESETSRRQEAPSTSSPSRTSSGHSTIKHTSTSRKSISNRDVQESRNETAQDADATITSDNAMDSFGLNLASIEGISKRSSYLKIANEIYEDPHILESTRASAALNDDSEIFPSRRSSSSSRRTETNIEQLEERLAVIKTKYNEIEGPLRKLGAAFEATKGSFDADSDDNASRSEAQPVKPMKLDDVSISESWIADAIGGSNERSLNSVPSSYSGDLTGSDLEDF